MARSPKHPTTAQEDQSALVEDANLKREGGKEGGRVGPALSGFSQETPEETVQPGKIKLEEFKVIQAISGC